MATWAAMFSVRLVRRDASDIAGRPDRSVPFCAGAVPSLSKPSSLAVATNPSNTNR